jgi:hypothetical protein
MATFKTFEEITVWQKSRELTKLIYDATTRGNFARDYALRDQIRRASVSIMSNIAEGFERSGTAEFNQFLATAKGRQARLEPSCMLRWTSAIWNMMYSIRFALLLRKLAG